MRPDFAKDKRKEISSTIEWSLKAQAMSVPERELLIMRVDDNNIQIRVRSADSPEGVYKFFNVRVSACSG